MPTLSPKIIESSIGYAVSLNKNRTMETKRVAEKEQLTVQTNYILHKHVCSQGFEPMILALPAPVDL